MATKAAHQGLPKQPPTTEKDLPVIKAANTEELTGKGKIYLEKDLANEMTLYDECEITNDDYNDYVENGNIREGLSWDFFLFVDAFRRIFTTMFKWEGLEKWEMRSLEDKLFLYGKCAIYKMPDGDLIFSDFSFDDGDLDCYGYPHKITLIYPKGRYSNSLNGKKLNRGSYIVIFNNSSYLSTLLWLYKRLKFLLYSLVDVDNANLISVQKVLIPTLADDMLVEDINKFFRSKKIAASVTMSLKDGLNNTIIELEDRSKSKQENFLFHLNLILKLLGFEVNENVEKKERQTEMEVAKQASFEKYLLINMWNMREEGAEMFKGELGITITPIEPDILKEKKPEVNGEENKKVIKNDEK